MTSLRGFSEGKRSGSPSWVRTSDPRINSPLLCQLSYRGTGPAKVGGSIRDLQPCQGYTADVQALQLGDPIDVVAPSSAFERERFDRGVRALRQIGLTPRFSEAIFTKTGHLAGDDARRRTELEQAFKSDAKALILARGGYGLLRFAASLSAIPRKLVIGYSDTTVLHELWRRAGLPSIHGPMCTQLGGCIVLLEDLNEPPYRLDRFLTQLLLGGVLEKAKAFVIGDLTAPGEDTAGRDEVVAERLAPLNVPVVFGAPFGHAGRNQPVAFGCAHALDAQKGTLTPLETPSATPQS